MLASDIKLSDLSVNCINALRLYVTMCWFTAYVSAYFDLTGHYCWWGCEIKKGTVQSFDRSLKSHPDLKLWMYEMSVWNRWAQLFKYFRMWEIHSFLIIHFVCHQSFIQKKCCWKIGSWAMVKVTSIF